MAQQRQQLVRANAPLRMPRELSFDFSAARPYAVHRRLFTARC
jgi:hypothetical protein